MPSSMYAHLRSHSAPGYTALLFCLLAAPAFCPAGAQGRTSAPPLPPQSDSSAPRAVPAPVPAPHTPAPNHARPRAPEPTAGRTLRLAPQGRWWDDQTFSRTLAIDTRQQRRLDQVFGANRDQLLKLYTDLKREEAQLDKLGKTSNETEIDRQIEKVAQARGELQKADTHMVLEIRKQLTPEQLSKLDAVQ